MNQEKYNIMEPSLKSIKIVKIELPDGREKYFTVTIKDGYVMFYCGGELVNFHCDYSGTVDEIDLSYCYLNSLLWNIRQCGRFPEDVIAVDKYISIQQEYETK